MTASTYPIPQVTEEARETAANLTALFAAAGLPCLRQRTYQGVLSLVVKAPDFNRAAKISLEAAYYIPDDQHVTGKVVTAAVTAIEDGFAETLRLIPGNKTYYAPVSDDGWNDPLQPTFNDDLPDEQQRDINIRWQGAPADNSADFVLRVVQRLTRPLAV